jgi:hypothetical protein
MRRIVTAACARTHKLAGGSSSPVKFKYCVVCTWFPASEVRGEGIFLRLQEDALQVWENRKEVKQLHLDFLASHKRQFLAPI